MANYRPKGKIITSASAKSGVLVPVNITQSDWEMLLVKGTAMHSNSVLASGAVEIWEDTDTAAGTPDHTTFADSTGKYGITCKANVKLVLKFYNA